MISAVPGPDLVVMIEEDPVVEMRRVLQPMAEMHPAHVPDQLTGSQSVQLEARGQGQDPLIKILMAEQLQEALLGLLLDHVLDPDHNSLISVP